MRQACRQLNIGQLTFTAFILILGRAIWTGWLTQEIFGYINWHATFCSSPGRQLSSLHVGIFLRPRFWKKKKERKVRGYLKHHCCSHVKDASNENHSYNGRRKPLLTRKKYKGNVVKYLKVWKMLINQHFMYFMCLIPLIKFNNFRCPYYHRSPMNSASRKEFNQPTKSSKIILKSIRYLLKLRCSWFRFSILNL